MANFYVSNTSATTPARVNASSTYATQVALTAVTATLRRIKIYDILVGTSGTPVDAYQEWDVSRQTTSATASTGAVTCTPNPIDPGDGAAVTVCGINPTSEGTVTANSGLFYISLNTRASYRWVASPGSELVGPATNVAGLTLRAKATGYTSLMAGTILFTEQ